MNENGDYSHATTSERSVSSASTTASPTATVQAFAKAFVQKRVRIKIRPCAAKKTPLAVRAIHVFVQRAYLQQEQQCSFR